MRAARRNGILALIIGAAAMACLGALAAPGLALAGQTVDEAPKQLWTLRIKQAVAVSGDRPLLGEIAEPAEGFPEAAWKSLSRTPLWKSPEKPGAMMVIPADKVVNALRYYLRDAPVEYLAPNQVAVRRGGRVLNQEELGAMAVEYLTQKIKDFPGQASIAKVDAPAYLFVDGGPEAVSVEGAGELKPGANKLYFADHGERGEKSRAVRKTPFNAEISLVVQAAVAARPINASEGQIIPSMIAFERMDVSRLSGVPWDGGGGPWRVKTSVGQGQVVYQENLEPMPAICRGDKVTLAYRGKRIRLLAEAEAVTDGFMGKEITVRNLQSGVQVSGRVEGPGAVVVQ